MHALELRMPWSEIDTPYVSRPEGSESKLSTYKDGYRIIRMILRLFIAERPLQFFGTIALVAFAAGVAIAIPLLSTYLATHEVPRLPTALLSTGLALIAALSLVCGVIMDAVTRGAPGNEATVLPWHPRPSRGRRLVVDVTDHLRR